MKCAQLATVLTILGSMSVASAASAGTLASGTYNFKDASGNTWDGGFSKRGDPFVYEFSYNNGPDQQFIWNGSTLRESSTGTFAFNNSGTLGLGSSAGSFTIASSGSGYTIQDSATGLYVNSPFAQAPPNRLGLSSSATVWTAVLISGVGGTPLAPGTYNFRDSSGNTWDGGFSKRGDPFVYEFSYNNGPDQQFIWNGSTLRESSTGTFAFNNSGTLGLGSSAGSFTVASSGSGYTIQDNATGLYVNSPFAQSPPNKLGLASSATVWTAVAVGGDRTTINDTDPAVLYTLPSSWTYFQDGSSSDYQHDEHSSNFVRPTGPVFQGAGVIVNFRGTGITWVGKKGPNYGIAAYSIDGGMSHVVDNYNQNELDQSPIAAISGLPFGSHCLFISLLQSKNAASRDFFQTIDAFVIDGSPLPPSQGTAAGFGSSALAFTGSWSGGRGSDGSDRSGGHYWSNQTNASVSWSFTGSLVEVIGRPDLEDGFFDVHIDGSQVARIDGHFGVVDDDSLNADLLFAAKVSPGQHTITLVVSGTHDAGATNNFLQLDELIAFP